MEICATTHDMRRSGTQFVSTEGEVMPKTTIYTAKRIITMNPANPEGSAVAVRDGRILGVGTVDELAAWGDHTVDTRFEDRVLMPGLVEAHCHAMSGMIWAMPYVGYFDRMAPNGQIIPGCQSIAEVVGRLKEADEAMRADGAAEDEVLVGRGVDPLYFEGERMYGRHLDEVSVTRPIFIQHASGHLATVNSALMEREGITRDSTTPGVDKDVDGEPNGELQEPPAMQLATEAQAVMLAARAHPDAIWNFGREAVNTGHTTVIDLASGPLDAADNELWSSIVEDPGFPTRVVRAASVPRDRPSIPTELAAVAAEMKSEGTDKLHYGVVKLFLDGSIQGFTARVSWPYYIDPPAGHPGNGIWLTAPDQIADVLMAYHEKGLTVHCHCNGDEATEAYLDAVEEVLERHPRWDHRHTVQHCQLTKSAQYRRMKALGMCANIFTNHLWYWGDQHRDFTMGHERARGMDACATALREGVSFSIHSDAGVTPLGSLHVAWCAVNRVTPSGDTLGEFEKISVADALYAITLGAAFQIKMDHLVGSIEAGKFADFAVLAEDPLEIDPMRLRDIEVWGTVLGGVPIEAGTT